MIDPADLGKQVLERRKQQGLTQEQLGHALCLSAQAVSKWENGESLPDIGVFPALCQALNTSADALLGIDSELGIETVSAKLAQRLGRLKSREERDAALTSALAFLNPARDQGWNPDRNTSYELEEDRLVGLTFWSSRGLVCFARGQVLEDDGSSPDLMKTIRTLVSSACWKVARLLLNGPGKPAALLAAGGGDSPESLLDALDQLIEAGIAVQDRGGYRLEETYGLLLTALLNALCLESLRTGPGRGVHVNRTSNA